MVKIVKKPKITFIIFIALVSFLLIYTLGEFIGFFGVVTILSYNSSDMQFHISVSNKIVKIYDMKGKKEQIELKENTNHPKIVSEILLRPGRSGNFELRVDAVNNIMKIYDINNFDLYIIPFDSKAMDFVKLPSLYQTLDALGRNIDLNPFNDKTADFKEFCEFFSVYYNSRIEHFYILTNQYIFAQIDKKIKTFKVDLTQIIKNYNIPNITDNLIIGSITAPSEKIVMSMKKKKSGFFGISFKRRVFHIPLRFKEKQLIDSRQINEIESKHHKLKNFDYLEYKNSEFINKISEKINLFSECEEFQCLINKIRTSFAKRPDLQGDNNELNLSNILKRLKN